MKEINKFTEKELKAYLDKYRAIQRDATRRSRSRGEVDVKGAIREAKDAASMITNINYKINHDTWLYNDLPDGTFIGSRRVVASGDKTLINKLVDSSKTYSLGTSQASFTGLDHLEGKTVLAWGGNADANGEGTGKYLGEYTVSGGSITLSTDQTDTNVVNTLVVGLKYNAQMKSMKLPYASQLGTPLNQRKRLYSLGFVLHNTITTNLKYGYSFDNLDSFPEYNEGENKGDDYLWSHYDSDMMEFDGEYTTDPRIHIQAESPYPCTILAITAGIKTNDKG